MTFHQSAVARVTDRDIEAAAEASERLKESPRGFTDLLFSVPSYGPAQHMSPRDRAAVGVVLTYNSGCWEQHEDQLLQVIRAVGRVHRRDTDTGYIMQPGVIMLAGEVAARYLYQQLAREHGPHGLEPLAAAIAVVWPLPGETVPHVQGNPAMALLRLTTGPYKNLFTTAEIQAMRLLARALPTCDPVPQLRCAARICETITRYRGRFRGHCLTAVREAVVTARTTGKPQSIPATLG